MIIAQISDMHVAEAGGENETRYNGADGLARAVAHLNRLDPAPELVVATGDLVADGRAAEYDRLKALLEPLAMPIYLLPGNHDDREALRAAFAAGHPYLPAEGFLHYVVEAGPLRLVMLDTLVPGEAGGRLCAERLDWLDARLAEAPDRPTIVCLHHPPFVTGLRKMDQMGLDGAGGLGAVIDRHGQVERLLSGHLHRPITRRFHGTVALTCPSTTFQLALDLRAAEKLALADEPPTLLLHLWDDTEGLVTHTSYIDGFETVTIFDGNDWVTALKPDTTTGRQGK